MLKKRFLVLAAVPLALACSSSGDNDAAGAGGASAAGGMAGVGGQTTANALIVPESLSVSARTGGNGVLHLFALTLRKGPSNTELYAALKNDGDMKACAASLSVELFDKAEQSLAASISGLLTKHAYRFTDGSGTIAACVGPGDVTMAAITDLPSDLVIDDVKFVVYQCTYFALDVVPIEGLSVGAVQSVTSSAGTDFTGTLVNRLDVAVRDPSVTVFPVTGVGRPLGVATGSGIADIPPGGSWAFETNRVDTPGVGAVAYPAASIVK